MHDLRFQTPGVSPEGEGTKDRLSSLLGARHLEPGTVLLGGGGDEIQVFLTGAAMDSPMSPLLGALAHQVQSLP